MAEEIISRETIEHDGFVYRVGQEFTVGEGGRIKIVGFNNHREIQVEYIIPMTVFPDYLAARGTLVPHNG